MAEFSWGEINSFVLVYRKLIYRGRLNTIKKLDYLYRTGQGQYFQHMDRYRQEINLIIPMEPRSKNSINENEKRIFQNHVHEQMSKLKRRAFQGPVILEIQFYSAASNPPHIHTLAKNYLDLLSEPIDKINIKRKNLLYQDDRQVKTLIVNHHIEEPHENPKITIKIARLSNFIKDLKLIRQIENNDFDCEARNPYKKIDELLDLRNSSFRSDFSNELDFYEEIKSTHSLFDSDEIKRDLEESALYRLQKSFLEELVFNILDLVRLYLEVETNFTKGVLSDISYFANLNYRKKFFLFNEENRITIEGLPSKKGEGKEFRNRIRQTVNEIADKFSFLNSLLVNLSLLILYIPPANRNRFR
ncbi:MAG TPA: RusA family crossover junction endodeoxyribonuclease [Bacilli bacterium]|nr:RusA family crossover junction endodeoxyribonuclease [Bacilli bacterium]